MIENDILTLLATIAAVTIATVGVITFIYERRKFRLAALVETYRFLGDIRHREARKVLYGNESMASYEILSLVRPTADGGASTDELERLAKDIVRSDLNHVGTLIQHKLLDENTIVSEYNWMIQKSWSLLEADIMNRRNGIGPSNYMENFETLRKKAEKWSEKRVNNST